MKTLGVLVLTVCVGLLLLPCSALATPPPCSASWSAADIAIKGNAATTTSRNVDLDYVVMQAEGSTSGNVYMHYSTDGKDWTNWADAAEIPTTIPGAGTYGDSIPVQLPARLGTKTVYLQFYSTAASASVYGGDPVEAFSPVYSDTIRLVSAKRDATSRTPTTARARRAAVVASWVLDSVRMIAGASTNSAPTARL